MSARTSGRRFGLGIAAVAVIGAGVAAWLVGSRVQSPNQAAARAAPPEASWVTAPVERRVLAATVITRGDVRPIRSTSIAGPAPATGPAASGTGVVTGLWVAVGDEVTAGQRVVEVSGRPVFVFEGATPAYRALRPGMAGADVGQLQAGLVALGCDAGDSGTYDDTTKECVAAMYRDAGYAVVLGSESELADLGEAEVAVDAAGDQLAVANAALDAARRPADAATLAAAQRDLDAATRARDDTAASGPAAVTTAVESFDAALRSLNGLLAAADPTAAAAAGSPDAGAAAGPVAPASGVAERDSAWTDVTDARRAVDVAVRRAAGDLADADAAVAAATDALTTLGAPPDTSAEQLAVDQATAALSRAKDRLADLQAVSGAVVPAGEVVFVPELPARVGSIAASVGGGAGATSGDPGSGGAGALVVLASPALEASISLTPSARPLVQEGMPVELLDEVSGESVTGTVTAITDRPAASGNAPAAYTATVDADLPETWAGRNVRATLTSASTDHEVLVVPAAAVSSGADGAARVRVERADGSVETLDVHVGLSADGFVEVEPETADALDAGDRVVVGR